MNVSVEEKRKEAILRMQTLGINEDVVKLFKLDGTVSESCSPLGACYIIDEEQAKRVREFESSYSALVYHVIRTTTTIGEMESYLYVSDHDDEWEFDRAGIEDNSPIVYVCNLDAPECSEFGSICVEKGFLCGLIRTW